MSFTSETDLEQSEVLSKATTHLEAVGYKVKTKGYMLEGKNGRDYTTWVAVILFLFFFIPFLIYWFTRTKNTVTVDATKQGKVTVSYKGSKAVKEAERLNNMFKK